MSVLLPWSEYSHSRKNTLFGGGFAVFKDKRHVYKLSRCQAVWSLTVFDNKRKVQRALIRTRETGYISRRYLFSVVLRFVNNSNGSSL